MEPLARESRRSPSNAEHTADQLRRIWRLLRATAQEDWTSLSLTRAQLRILVLLHQEGPTSVGQLAGAIGVTLPSITATVDRLVQHGLVRREDDPSDRRRVINGLTSEGTALIERLHVGKRARLVGALGMLGEADLETLSALLHQVEQALEGLVESPEAPTGA